MPVDNLKQAKELMEKFTERTGLAPGRDRTGRYLWTDAFALCNLLELGRLSGETHHIEQAWDLVHQVHFVLGRHREDDSRHGWISGLDEEQGWRHPTRGGLRIGKRLLERDPGEPLDEREEIERDGQYYHYLTKWMHGLDQLSRSTGEPEPLRWAVEMAKAVHRAFTYRPSPGEPKRMYWKMSLDLSRPLVPFMGQHDPLDGLIATLQLQANPKRHQLPEELELGEEVEELAEMCSNLGLITQDPLGIGGLLCQACLAVQLQVSRQCGREDLPGALLEASAMGLKALMHSDQFKLEPQHRLAFRELGLSIGLHGIPRINKLMEERPETFTARTRLKELVEGFLPVAPLAERIEEFWLQRGNQETASWRQHEAINTAMLATSLVPDGFLML